MADSGSELNRYRPADNLDPDLQRELDEALGDMSLEQIIASEQVGDKDAKGNAPRGTGKGVRKGHVVAVQGENIFVDMGGKSQGVLSASQFDENTPYPNVGDVIEVTIEGYNNAEGLLVLSRQGAVMAAAWETLDEGQIVDARVTGHNKGGLECVIGGIQAFMPISQIELYRVEDISPYVGQKFRCQVIEVDPEDRRVIISRRAILELEAAQEKEKAWETIAEGQEVDGIVRNIMPYGAFVTIGPNMDGLLHVGDMAYTRVEDPKTIVAEGQKVRLKVLKVDRETRKISLGLKQCMPDPWTSVAVKYLVNDVVTGKITRLADFGAFVELEAGVEGLVPVSEITFERRINHPQDVLSANQMIRVRVMSVDAEKKRISLSLKRVGDDPWTGASARWPADSVVTGVVKRIAEFGAFVELTPGVEGLVHISELSTTHVKRVQDVVKEGQSVQAKVISVDEDARRISLSVKQAQSMMFTASAAEIASASAGTVTVASAEPAATAKKRKKPLKGGLE